MPTNIPNPNQVKSRALPLPLDKQALGPRWRRGRHAGRLPIGGTPAGDEVSSDRGGTNGWAGGGALQRIHMKLVVSKLVRLLTKNSMG